MIYINTKYTIQFFYNFYTYLLFVSISVIYAFVGTVEGFQRGKSQ